MKKLLIGIVISIILLSLISIPVTASESQCRTDDSTISNTVGEVSQKSNNTVKIVFNLSSERDGLSIVLQKSVSITSYDGFKRNNDTLTWDGLSDTPSVSYKIPNQTTAGGYASGEDWMIAPLPANYPPSIQFKSENGIIRSNYILFGDFKRETVEDGCKVYEVFTLRNSSINGQKKAEILHRVDNELQIEEKGWETTTAVYNPKGREHIVATTQLDVIIVTNTGKSIYPNHAIYHEAVHTNQRVSNYNHSTMLWIIEGSAEYYSSKFEANTFTGSRIIETSYLMANYHLSQNESLNSPDSRLTNYRKGLVVTYVLDQKIRKDTGGNKTLEDVLKSWQSEHNKRTNEAFKNHIEDETGADYDEFFDKYVYGTSTPYPSVGITAQIIGFVLGTIYQNPLVFIPIYAIAIAVIYRVSVYTLKKLFSHFPYP